MTAHAPPPYRRRCRSLARRVPPVQRGTADSPITRSTVCDEVLRRQRGPARHRPPHRSRASSSPSSAAAAAARARCCACWLGLDQADGGEFWFGDGEAPSRAARRCASCSRSRGCCPGRRVLANVEVGLGEERSPRSARARAGDVARSRAWPTGATNGRRCCPAGSSSAWRWRARWSAGRACWRSTSRWARSMR